MLWSRVPSFGRYAALALLRKPKTPRYVPSAFSPPKPPRKGAVTLRKDRNPQTQLIRAIYKGVKELDDDHEEITTMVNKTLDTFIPKITQPEKSYETVIRFLLSRECIPAMVSVYDRMAGVGYAVTLRLQARMLVVLMAKTFGVEEDVLEGMWNALMGVVRNKGCTQKDLWDILAVMDNHHYRPELLLTTLDNFYETHKGRGSVRDVKLYKRFLHRGTEEGQVEAGLRSLAMLGRSRVRGPRGAIANQAYAAFIAGVRDTLHPDREAIGSALKMMMEQGVKPDIAVVNSLISLEVHGNSLHRAFALYHSVRQDPRLRPDEFTFGSLFNILNRLYNPKRRKVRQGRFVADDVPSPRTLYREMMEALLWKRTGLAFQLSTSLLNVVLRSFVYKCDYVGAVVALRCFTALRVPVNVVTYKLVLSHFKNRITYGIRAYRRMGDDTWADRFLGLPYPVMDPAFLANLKLGNQAMVRILDVCRRREFRLDWPMFVGGRKKNCYGDVPVVYKVPSGEYVLGRSSVSVHTAFDVVPLERLLRKAVLCEADAMRELGYGEEAEAYISGVVEEARGEMVPRELDVRREEMERRREAVMESRKRMFEGYVRRRQRRRAQLEVAEALKSLREVEEGVGLPDAVVIETEGEDIQHKVTVTLIDGVGGRRSTWTNQKAEKKRKVRKGMRRKSVVGEAEGAERSEEKRISDCLREVDAVSLESTSNNVYTS